MKGFTKAIHKNNIYTCVYAKSSDKECEEDEDEEMRKRKCRSARGRGMRRCSRSRPSTREER